MTPTSTCDPAPRRPEPRSTVARPRRVVHALALMLGLGLLLSGTTGCLSVQAGSEQRGADVDGIVSGYVSADALRPYDGTILDFGLLKNTEQKGEILSFDLWPIGGFGIGLAGARVRLLPFEVGLGALFYHPDPPEHGGRHHGHHSDDHDHGHHEHRHHDGCDDDCCGECRGGECCGEWQAV